MLVDFGKVDCLRIGKQECISLLVDGNVQTIFLGSWSSQGCTRKGQQGKEDMLKELHGGCVGKGGILLLKRGKQGKYVYV